MQELPQPGRRGVGRRQSGAAKKLEILERKQRRAAEVRGGGPGRGVGCRLERRMGRACKTLSGRRRQLWLAALRTKEAARKRAWQGLPEPELPCLPASVRSPCSTTPGLLSLGFRA